MRVLDVVSRFAEGRQAALAFRPRSCEKARERSESSPSKRPHTERNDVMERRTTLDVGAAIVWLASARCNFSVAISQPGDA